jgi:site-specific DNA-cytosine methylase
MNELALFAGAGGGILGGHLLGWRTVCAVEWEQYPASVLCARQNDKLLPPFPVWDDVQTFDGRPWRGIVDVISGGFPCQDISAAGKGEGITGSRSSMWKHMARIISEVRPQFVFVENSPMLTIRGLGVVLGDLSEMGFDAEWGVISAADIGAPHLRERIWIVARNVANTYSCSNSESIREVMEQKKRKQREDKSIHIATGNIRGANSHEWGDSMLGLESITKESKESNVANSNCRRCGGRGAVKQSGENSIRGLQTQEAEQAGNDLWGETIRCNSVRGEENNVANSNSKGEQWEYGIQVDGCSRCNFGQAYATNAEECGEMERISDVAYTSMSGFKTRSEQASRPQQRVLEEQSRRSSYEYRAGRYNWPSEPNVGRVVNGMASRVDRLKAIGNGQVSGVAATAWTLLNERFNK